MPDKSEPRVLVVVNPNASRPSTDEGSLELERYAGEIQLIACMSKRPRS